MPKALIREAGPLQATRVEGAKSGRLKICIATPGWGSSGYYSAQVLENAAKAKVFPAGTQSFLDHETESEKYERPERSVRDLAAVQVEDAVWESDTQRLTAQVQVFGAYVDLLTDEQFAQTVGMSMRAYAESTIGEAEGKKGRIITELIEALSVDVVTRAGRGGALRRVREGPPPPAGGARARPPGGPAAPPHPHPCGPWRRDPRGPRVRPADRGRRARRRARRHGGDSQRHPCRTRCRSP